ncbi:MAG: Hsp20/alpha crystallin family protein [Desulfarculus sp.]|jgi:HSP20 family protein|nr:MAG: Hsp20/alpha crystallin family protein [Desulfarculus sp.]
MDRDFPLGGRLFSARLRQMLDNLQRPGPSEEGGAWSPAVDIVETPQAVVIVAELAGVRREDIKVLVDGEVVRIYGRREPSLHQPGARYHRLEIESGDFVRSFRIGVPFDPQGVEATTSMGLLKITLPKREASRRKIDVEAV